MTHSTQEKIGSPQPDILDELPTRLRLVSRWTSEDIRQFFGATRLCEACQIMFGPSHLWTKPKLASTSGPSDRYMDRVYQHHPSKESLLYSLSNGCDLCTMAHAQWTKTAPNSRDIGPLLSFFTLNLAEFISITIWDNREMEPVNQSEWGNAWTFCTDIMIVRQSRSGNTARFGTGTFSELQSYTFPCRERIEHVSIAQQWIRSCQSRSEHSICAKYRQQPRMRPTRLLYLDPRQPDLVQLIMTDSMSDSSEYVYITLSHRWGAFPNPEPPKLSRHTMVSGAAWISITEFQSGISQSRLPQTFRDAFRIARHCEVRYMWIDCLCIVQDKDSHGKNPEWDQEAVKMGDIYAGGLLNIAAVDSQHPDHGLFPNNTDRLLLGVSEKHLANGIEPLVVFRYPNDAFDDEVVHSGLMSRGWVYQEILLSPANLYCGDAQMWWSCAHTSRSETFPIHHNHEQQFGDRIQRNKNALMGHSQSNGPTENWISVLHGYTSTTLTFAHDRIIALKGVSDLFRSLYPHKLQDSEYHSGLWSADVMMQLPWGFLCSEHEVPARVSTTNYLIPSWSPLKSIGRGSRSLLSGIESCHRFVLPNRLISMNTSRLDEFGRATSWKECQIHLQGVLVGIIAIDVYPDGDYRLLQIGHPEGHADVHLKIFWDNAEEQALAASISNNQVQAFTLAARYRHDDSFPPLDFELIGILLRPFNAQGLSTSPQQTRRWVRCGHFTHEMGSAESGSAASQVQHKVVKCENAFQIVQKYGVSWGLENPEDDKDQWRWRQRHLHDPELEDIYLV